MPLRAVLFDMDGVIVDTMNLHYDSAVHALGVGGIKISRKDAERVMAKRAKDAFVELGVANSDVEKLVDENYSFLKGKAAGIKPFPGFLDFFDLARKNFPVGLCSASRRDFVEFVLREIGIMPYFSVILGGDDVENGKPDPECYLKAAAKLGVKPVDCLVVEDSLVGVLAGKKAGMKVVAVTNTHDRIFLQDADLIVDSLAELSVEKISGLFDA